MASGRWDGHDGVVPTASTSSGIRRLAAVAGVVALALALAAGFGASAAVAAGDEWNIARVKAPMSAAGTTIAVVDTGVDANHPAFGGRVLAQIDFVKDGKQGDPEGHGTHVSGTAAGASANNGCSEGAIGVAPDAKILPVRVLDADGSGTLSAVAAGIRAAADRGATVINLSLGGDVVIRAVDGGGNTLRDAIEYAWNKGSIPVLAAGNDGVTGALLGSGYGGIKAVVVTATDNQDRVASYATSIGSADWGIAAPGGDASGKAGRDVLSSYPDSKCALAAGTSMATPHVAGALAVLRSKGLTKEQAVTRMLETARDLGSAGVDGTYGYGLLDLAAATNGLGGPTPTAGGPAVTSAAAPTTSPTTARPASGGSGVPATRPPGSEPTPSTEPAVTDDAGATDNLDAGDATGLDITGVTESSVPADASLDQVAGADSPGNDDSGGGLGAVPVGLAVLACGAAWVVTGRAALAARR